MFSANVHEHDAVIFSWFSLTKLIRKHFIRYLLRQRYDIFVMYPVRNLPDKYRFLFLSFLSVLARTRLIHDRFDKSAKCLFCIMFLRIFCCCYCFHHLLLSSCSVHWMRLICSATSRKYGRHSSSPVPIIHHLYMCVCIWATIPMKRREERRKKKRIDGIFCNMHGFMRGFSVSCSRSFFLPVFNGFVHFFFFLQAFFLSSLRRFGCWQSNASTK